MARERLVVGIDVGSAKICTLIANVSEDDQLEIMGCGVARSEGLKKGVVVGVEEAARQIQSSVQKAEQQSGFKILSAFVSVSGSHIQTESTHGVATVRHQDASVTEQDVARAMEAARTLHLPLDRQLIDVVPRHFVVDGQEDITSPVGMVGHRLEVQTLAITASRSALHNLTSCVDRAGVNIDALVLSPLAAAEATLTPTERDIGVTLIDFGGGSTDLAVFLENSLAFSSVLPVGGSQITNDLAVRLRTPFSAAEEVKLRHGQAFVNQREDDRVIDVAGFESDESQSVSVRLVIETIEDRLVDTFERVQDRLAKGGFEDSLPAGVVLVGGTAQLVAIRRLATELLESPVRIGSPAGIFGLTDQISTPAFATPVGLLKWGLAHEDGGGGAGGSFFSDAWASIQAWLRAFRQ